MHQSLVGTKQNTNLFAIFDRYYIKMCRIIPLNSNEATDRINVRIQININMTRIPFIMIKKLLNLLNIRKSFQLIYVFSMPNIVSSSIKILNFVALLSDFGEKRLSKSYKLASFRSSSSYTTFAINLTHCSFPFISGPDRLR